MEDFSIYRAAGVGHVWSETTMEQQSTAWYLLCNHFIPALIEKYLVTPPPVCLQVEMGAGVRTLGWCLFTYVNGTRLCLLKNRHFLRVTGLNYSKEVYVVDSLELDKVNYTTLDLLVQSVLPHAVVSMAQYDKYSCFLSTLWDTQGAEARRANVILPTH